MRGRRIDLQGHRTPPLVCRPGNHERTRGEHRRDSVECQVRRKPRSWTDDGFREGFAVRRRPHTPRGPIDMGPRQGGEHQARRTRGWPKGGEACEDAAARGMVHTVPYGSPYARVWQVGLTRNDWTLAALYAIAGGGIAAVAVEPLAKQLGATKGSFYWHFANRDELVGAALDMWERLGTTDVIEELDQVADPTRRLERLFELAFLDEFGGAADVNLLAEAGDPRVGQVIERVTARRVEFLAATFRELALPPPEARRRALLCYGAYVGHFQLRRAAPAIALHGRALRSYVAAVLRLLVADAPSPAMDVTASPPAPR